MPNWQAPASTEKNPVGQQGAHRGGVIRRTNRKSPPFRCSIWRKFHPAGLNFAYFARPLPPSGKPPSVVDDALRNKPAHAVPLASARKHPEIPKGKPGQPFAGARGGGSRRADSPWAHSPKADEGPGWVKAGGQARPPGGCANRATHTIQTMHTTKQPAPHPRTSTHTSRHALNLR